jgi:hypothetical protein
MELLLIAVIAIPIAFPVGLLFGGIYYYGYAREAVEDALERGEKERAGWRAIELQELEEARLPVGGTLVWHIYRMLIEYSQLFPPQAHIRD